ncbi:AAA family ATPase [Paenibacillus odorifer]|uniref:AAA family ATPase n=1 Tax=Paenibacillus odorifer TaxID=189426 RepID=UPI0020BF3185|nr:AAA family ATPase [Paenibacillus odorifer]
MKFYICGFSRKFTIPTSITDFPAIVLMSDNWNDYGYQTYFYLYFIHNEEDFSEIGACKIGNIKDICTRAVIPWEFDELSEEYFSLGQSLEFYDNIRKFGGENTRNLLRSLRDVALNDDIYYEFKNKSVFKESLLRFSEADKALKEAKSLFGEEIEKILNFKFEYKLPNATSPHVVNLDFTSCEIPYRINSFVGKNATGKTRILTELASRLSGAKKVGDSTFTPDRPSFSKIIAISYSAFDELYKPFDEDKVIKDEKDSAEWDNESSDGNNREEDTIFGSYVYCGLRNSKGLLKLSEIEANFFNAYDRVMDRGRNKDWLEIMSNILEDEHLKLIEEIGRVRQEHKGRATNYLRDNLSSGQNILVSTMTEVIANIEVDSLLLFDEPELHLHPNAIANFMRMFYEILNKFNSYAIVSTHSPLIIQEIPSKFVKLFNRSHNTPYIIEPAIQCFGENIGVLTNDIFEVRERESNYKTWFKKMKNEGKSYEYILDIFEENLSYNASTYLNSLFPEYDEVE